MTANCSRIAVALCLLTIFTYSSLVRSDNSTKPMLELSKYLFHDYDGLVRPVIDGKSPTLVKFRMQISALLDMDTRNQRFKITTWAKTTWTDEFLTWNASEFGGIDVIHVHANKIWLPDITLHQNVDESFEIIHPDTYVKISSDGFVTWYAPTIYGNSCRQRVRYFPFDTQVCPMRFSSWAYDGTHIKLKAEVGADAAQNRFLDNGVWRFISVKTAEETIYYPCCPNNPYYEVTNTLTFKRNASFYVGYLILPCVFLAALSLLVFYLPPDCGEKLTLSITNLLALVVFQQLIAQTMPPTGDESPLLGTFFLIMIVMVCVSVVATVLVIHVGYKKTPMPHWIEVFVIEFLGRCVCMVGPTQTGNKVEAGFTNDKISTSRSKCINGPCHANGEVISDIHIESNGIQRPVTVTDVEWSPLTEISRSVAVIRNDFELKADDEVMQAKWRMAAMIIDRWLLLSFIAYATIVCVTMTIYIIIMSEKEFKTLTEDAGGLLNENM